MSTISCLRGPPRASAPSAIACAIAMAGGAGAPGSAGAYGIPLTTIDNVQNTKLVTGLAQIQQMIDTSLRIRSLMEGGLASLGAHAFAGLAQLAPPGSQWLVDTIAESGGLGNLSWSEIAGGIVPRMVEPLAAQMGLSGELSLLARSFIDGGVEEGIMEAIRAEMGPLGASLDLPEPLRSQVISTLQSASIEEALGLDVMGALPETAQSLAALGLSEAQHTSLTDALAGRLGDINPAEHLAALASSDPALAEMLQGVTRYAETGLGLDAIVTEAEQRNSANLDHAITRLGQAARAIASGEGTQALDATTLTVLGIDNAPTSTITAALRSENPLQALRESGNDGRRLAAMLRVGATESGLAEVRETRSTAHEGEVRESATDERT